ncbi:MAG: transglycosylase, partial [Verrucomicrobiota bacterium]|nr:transglycosylase [Verrucomicrobiota bacterium]
MKKLLITSLASLTVALNLFAQTSPPPAAGSTPSVSASVPATAPTAPTAPTATLPSTMPSATVSS